MRKTRWSLVLALLLLAVNALPVLAAPPSRPAEEHAVYDYADVLSAEVEEAIDRNGAQLRGQGGPAIVLVTVDFTDGIEIGDYTADLYNDWELNNGLLILLSIGSEDYWAVQDEQLEDTIPAGDIQLILNNFLEDNFDAKNYDAGALATYRAFHEKLGGSWSDSGENTQRPPVQVSSRYVYDDTGYLTDQTVRRIDDLARNTSQRTGGASFAVALVQTTDGRDTEIAAYDFFNEQGYDGKTLLLYMTIAEDDYYFLPGDALTKVMTERRITDIMDHQTEPAFASKDYNAAALDTAQAVSELMLNNSSKLFSAVPDDSGDRFPAWRGIGSATAFAFRTILLIVVLILGVIIILVMPRRRYYRRYYGVPFNPFAPRYIRRYGPGGYWGRWGGPRPGFHSYPPPPPPPRSPHSGFGGPTSGGGPANHGGVGRRPSSGGAFGGSSLGSMFGGGHTRGGGAGRSSGGRSSFGGGRSFGGGSRSGGGASRGGGAGRRR